MDFFSGGECQTLECIVGDGLKTFGRVVKNFGAVKLEHDGRGKGAEVDLMIGFCLAALRTTGDFEVDFSG